MSAPTIDIVLVTGASLTTAVVSGAVNVTPYSEHGGSFQILFVSGGGTSKGTVFLETSNNGTDWDLYPNSTLNYTAATTSNTIQISYFGTKYVRVSTTNDGSGTGGTASIIAHLIGND